MTENERLSIDEVITHCNGRVELFERFSSREKCENWSLDSQYGKEYWEHRQVAEWLEEIKAYREIGTVEECRVAVERMKPKKAVKDEYDRLTCPNCTWIVYQDEYGGRSLPCCENCGQAIDWQ